MVVNVFSVSHSGSTWLNLLLGSHSHTFSVGEMKKLRDPEQGRCVLHGESCPVWGRFRRESRENPFVQLSRLTGRRVFIVNNSRKFLRYQSRAGIESRYIHLVRDGRAVVASMLRKGGEPSVWSAARAWRHDVKRNRRLLRRQEASRTLEVCYESLRADTGGRLREICGLIGIEYEARMLRFWESEKHYLGGSKGTLYSMCRRAGDERAAERIASLRGGQGNWDRSHYQRTRPEHFEDDRWRRELDWRQRLVFCVICGRTSRRYGYPALTGDR